MNIGERIRKVRREFCLTQTQFANRIGSMQNKITRYERNNRNPSPSVICSICKEFNVNKKWLETGEGEMFNLTSNNELETLIKKYDLPTATYVLVKNFLELKKEQRDMIIDFAKKVVVNLAEMESQEKSSILNEQDSITKNEVS